MRRPFAFFLLCASLLSGCEQLGIESPAGVIARKEADGKAVGGACRHAGRAIEDCFTLNKRADKAAMYAGWREMSEYMRENKIEPVAPLLQPDSAKPAQVAAVEGDSETADEPAATKSGAKPAAKHKSP